MTDFFVFNNGGGFKIRKGTGNTFFVRSGNPTNTPGESPTPTPTISITPSITPTITPTPSSPPAAIECDCSSSSYVNNLIFKFNDVEFNYGTPLTKEIVDSSGRWVYQYNSGGSINVAFYDAAVPWGGNIANEAPSQNYSVIIYCGNYDLDNQPAPNRWYIGYTTQNITYDDPSFSNVATDINNKSYSGYFNCYAANSCANIPAGSIIPLGSPVGVAPHSGPNYPDNTEGDNPPPALQPPNIELIQNCDRYGEPQDCSTDTGCQNYWKVSEGFYTDAVNAICPEAPVYYFASSGDAQTFINNIPGSCIMNDIGSVLLENVNGICCNGLCFPMNLPPEGFAVEGGELVCPPSMGNPQQDIPPDTVNWSGVAQWDGSISGNVTTVGTNGGPSHYGTYDQNGNVWEWTDVTATGMAPIGGVVNRRVWGGDYNTMTTGELRFFRPYDAVYRGINALTESATDVALGFRVCTFPAQDNQPRLSGIPMVYVGNPGNSMHQTSRNGNNVEFGAVPNTYWIGKYPVTNCEYAQYLNCVAYSGGANSNIVWNSGQHINRAGSSPNFVYTSEANYDNKPVIGVSWVMAARYCNWLTRNRPSGNTPNGPAFNLTSNGAYDLSQSNPIRNNQTAAKLTTYFLPTDHMWYKAAYYNGTGLFYNNYAIQTNIPPYAVQATLTGSGITPSNHSASFPFPQATGFARTTDYVCPS